MKNETTLEYARRRHAEIDAARPAAPPAPVPMTPERASAQAHEMTALKAEGAALAAAVARREGPAPAAPPAADDLSNLLNASAAMQLGKLRGHVSPETAAAVKAASDEAINKAARELQARNPSLSFYDAVVSVTRGRK